MLNKNERYAKRRIDGWAAVSLVACDCLKMTRKREERIERMRQRVVGWRSGLSARLRADEAGASEIVRRVGMVETWLQ